LTYQTPVIARDHFTAPIAKEIWEKKYRFVRHNGEIIDQTVEDTWLRVAHALAQAEKPGKRRYWTDKFYEALQDFKFLPAGRITSGAGTGRSVTLFNCFVMGTVPDSLGGIFDALREAALTMQQGGGIGYDFSTLRPKGAEVKGVDSDASGPLTFMDVWDSMCRTIMSAGERRGAMMATMRCDHPDVMDFITAKSDPLRLRMFNMSVLVTDPFMAAVRADEPWDLIFKGKVYSTIPALELWNAIMESTYKQAEPGVIFIDRINKTNNLNYCELIAATNPCGEQPLPPYGACLLGSINLARFVIDPFSKDALIDMELLKDTVAVAIRMMDNVVDVSNFPLPAQKVEAENKRRLGLGVTGLADMLLMLGLKYGSDEAVAFTDIMMGAIDNRAYLASSDLAHEKGSFPLLNVEEFLAEGTHASTLDAGTKQSIRNNGIRNSHVTSVAPTGTISLYAGNVSSGGEPIFAPSYTRKVLQKDGSKKSQVVEDYAVSLWTQMHPSKDMPDALVTAQDLTPEAHVKMQAAMQRHVDSSISKTVNLPEDISFDDFKEVYMLAYDLGCKGCTTYRPNDVTGSVISVDTPSEPAPQALPEVSAVDAVEPRSDALTGATYKLKWPDSEHAIYITVNDTWDGPTRRPYEVFINSKNMDHFQWTVALTRMVSAVFRRGGDVTFVVEELKAVFDPKGGAWLKGKFVPSILSAIGSVIEQHMIAIGYIPSSSPVNVVSDEPVEQVVKSIPSVPLCPKCMGSNFVKEGGCEICKDCGSSACG
jgi:ribonucleoside-diphosphate reductase alpha chain